MLTNFNGTAINYDAIGNPLNWRNSTSLTWKARELQSLTVTGGPSVAFEYNSDGIRTKKTVGGSVIHTYVLDGTKIIRETVTNNGAAFYDFYYLYFVEDSSVSNTNESPNLMTSRYPLMRVMRYTK